MTDDEMVAQEAAPEVVQTEVEQAEAPEAAESTEGQPEGQPAEDQESEEEKSASKARRERRKAAERERKEELERAKADRDRLAAQLAEYESFGATPPPRQEDFKDYDDYMAAKNAHAAMQAMDQRESARLKREAAEHDERLQRLERARDAEASQNWAAQSEEARKRYADFDAVVSAPDLPVTPYMARHLAQADNGADVAYHLGMNRDLAMQIASMAPAEQAGAIAMLDRMIPQQRPKPRTQTKAPDPISPVKAQGTPTKDPEKMSAAEFKAWRESGGTF